MARRSILSQLFRQSAGYVITFQMRLIYIFIGVIVIAERTIAHQFLGFCVYVLKGTWWINAPNQSFGQSFYNGWCLKATFGLRIWPFARRFMFWKFGMIMVQFSLFQYTGGSTVFEDNAKIANIDFKETDKRITKKFGGSFFYDMAVYPKNSNTTNNILTVSLML